MPKAYWVTSYRKIKDPETVAACAEFAEPAMWTFGGRYLARAGALSGGLGDGLSEMWRWPPRTAYC